MKRKLLTVFLLLMMALSMFSMAACSQSEPAAEPAAEETAEPVALTVSAAASLTDALTEIQTMYKEAAPEVTITYNFGSSGALQQQISEGAEVDVFIAAAAKQINTLKDEGRLVDESIVDLLGNRLVLVVPADSTAAVSKFEDAASADIAHLALGEPTSVPAGKYAEEVFTSLNMLDTIKAKAVYAKDVKEVLTWVESGNADAGVVYLTDAINSDKVKVAAEATEESHSPIVYPAAVINTTASPDAAQAFIDYLGSDDAKAVFEKYGFTIL